MMKNLLLSSFIFLFLSCSKQQPAPPIDSNKKALAEATIANDDSTLNLKDKAQFENIQIKASEPIAMASSNNVAVPILLEERYEDKGFPDHSFVNISIVLENESKAKLLFHQTMVIKHIQVFEPQVESVVTRDNFYPPDESDSIYNRTWPREFEGLIFFEACRFQNKKCDYQRLYCYDLKNDRLRQLSPENADVMEYRFFKGTSRVLITYSLDNNQDGVFGELEDQNISLVDFRSTTSQATLLLPLDSLKEFKREYSTAN
jgi:hypothetical protein